MKAGDKVLLVRRGSVAYTRSGFAFVRWDDGGESREWIAELVVEAAESSEAEDRDA
jgi:hypothetical protein